MNLILEEGIELPETTEIAFVGNLTSQQWEKLFNLVQYRIEIPSEVLPLNGEKLSSLNLEELVNNAITQWQAKPDRI
jgi:hypothetical protein